MKANELRIGNYVNDEYADGSAHEVQVDVEQIEYPHNCTPIPLTEEWLVNLGFFKHSKNARYTGYSYANNNAIIRNWVVRHFHERIGLGDYKKTNMFFWNKVNIKYVHQLQNLYFALTGEELELKTKMA